MTSLNINSQAHIAQPVDEKRRMKMQFNVPQKESRRMKLLYGNIRYFTKQEHYNDIEDDREQMMQRLEESDNKLKNFIDQSFEGILMFDHCGRITEWNPAIERITGLSKIQASGYFIWDVMWQLEQVRTPQRKDALYHNMLEYLKDGEYQDPLLEEKTLLSTNGQIHHVHTSTFPVKLSADLCHFGCVMRDITRQQQVDMELNRYRTNLEQMVKAKTRELTIAKEKAEQADRNKSAFLANISHELRTPLNGIVGLLNALANNEQLPDSIREHIDLINANSDQLLGLINDILDMSKIEAGKIALRPEEVRLDDLMNEMHVLFRNNLQTCNKSHINLEIHRNGFSNCVTEADPVRLRQILHNLLSNAVKFTGQGSIRFGYHLTDTNMLEFFVKDTGIGIPKNQQNIIFQRFRRIEVSNNSSYGGNGLGLSISRSLAQLMGGDMQVTSTEGEGSIFTFTIAYRPV